MSSRKILTILLAAGLAGLLISCVAGNGYRPPKTHPPIYELGERRVYCVRCHGYDNKEMVYERYNHTPYFTDNHRLVTYQNEAVCAMCHEQSFCNSCHATRVELKPSLRNQTENFRRTQHRGDYLSRHRIDGRIDPTSCFRCHGNPKASQTCRPCHG
ncbi:cytochrome C [Geoalkalibacter halelectricus]|uniref:Cytochrome C n=1 Tax=Geoalkalibacter halelectricus TaxID=2847045 RepID=A0ABY5ZQ74_9BACT|nr:cytochrome C [Geoalkalibacter halelectricus]MDO3376731.1 cytochrome C [Geoalkalibacter halelectricus]UWZ81317.1 cytochrome C [Geoalkalibacter halelectricus]